MKSIYKILILLFISNHIFAQPSPCGQTPVMANTCLDACIICDIDGYTGINDLQAGGQNIGNVFCSFADDMHFIAFIAGSTSLSVQISVTNCTAGDLNFFSLDIGLYESLDCQTFSPITPCQQDIGNNQSHIFNTDVPLTIGQHYYIIMDGSSASICNWTFDVLSGTTTVPVLETSGDISGNTFFCAEDEQEFEVNFPIGAANFEWTLQGDIIGGNSSTLNYLFTEAGFFQLCVTSSNACNIAPPSCIEIQIESVEDTEIMDAFCASDCYLYVGDTICDPGIYEYTFDNENGCDSTVILTLEEWEAPVLDLELAICDGDTVYIGDTPYFNTGPSQTVLTTLEGCDSIVNLDLIAVLCNIMSTNTATPAICYGTATGQINFSITNGTPPFTYTWENFNGTPSGSGNVSMDNQNETINNIPLGQYVVTINDGFGNTDIFLASISEPTVMTFSSTSSMYGNDNISCQGEEDGNLGISVEGGEPGYTYLWSNNELTSLIENIGADNYTVTVTDIVGCELIESFEITEPDALFLSSNFIDPGCVGNMTGYIVINELSGGTGPYNYFINNTPQNNTSFTNLGTGSYEVKIIDNNGCEIIADSSLLAAEIPIIELGEDQQLTLGESTTLYPVFNNISIENMFWSSTENLSCDSCLNPTLMPMFSANYTIEVTSEDGCTRSKSIHVRVLEERTVFIPTAFSPNNDGVNDYFSVFGSMPNVQEVEKFVIFDRWGGLLFENNNFLPNDIYEGWNGRSNGDELDNGVYMYYAKIRFWDNAVLVYKGDISLLR